MSTLDGPSLTLTADKLCVLYSAPIIMHAAFKETRLMNPSSFAVGSVGSGEMEHRSTLMVYTCSKSTSVETNCAATNIVCSILSSG